MRVRASWVLCALTTLVGSIFAVSPCLGGNISGIPATNVDSYFGSQSDSFQQVNGVGSSWTPIGTGLSPWYGLTSLPTGVPSYPLSTTTPSNVNPFTSPATATYSNAGDNANSFLLTSVGGSGTTDDAQLRLIMSLTQAPGTQYAYEQLNYDSDYTINNTNVVNSAGVSVPTGLLGSSNAPQFLVSGNILGSSNFATFGGIINYWDVPPGPGVPSLIGTYTYKYYNNTPGPYSTIVSGVGSTGGINGPDTLRLTGSFFVIADPATITVEPVPEPSTLALFAVGAIGFLGYVWRRRKQTI